MNHKVKLDIPGNFMHGPISAINAPPIIKKIKEATEKIGALKKHMENTDMAVLLDYEDSNSLELWDKRKDKNILSIKIGLSKDDDFRFVPVLPSSLMRDIIRSRQAPYFFVRKSLPKPTDIREERARETLFSIIGEEKFRDFLKKGFVCVRNPKSKRIYQIFTGHKLVNVYENGKKIERLCTHLPFGFPPTDSLIVRYLLAINDEDRLWKLSNKHGLAETKKIRVDRRPLPEIFKELKKDNLALAA